MRSRRPACGRKGLYSMDQTLFVSQRLMILLGHPNKSWLPFKNQSHHFVIKFGQSVEPEGFEPSSKQGTYKLSTCLEFAYLSGISRPNSVYLYRIPLNFRPNVRNPFSLIRLASAPNSLSDE